MPSEEEEKKKKRKKKEEKERKNIPRSARRVASRLTYSLFTLSPTIDNSTLQFLENKNVVD